MPELRREEIAKELVLYPYEDSLHSSRFRVECAPNLKAIALLGISKNQEYGGVVPGRQRFPKKEDIPLRAYDEKSQTLSDILAYVEITFQTTVHTGTGKITNVEYLLKKITQAA